MKILVLTSRVPYPPLGGDRLRLFHFVKSLAREHQITLLALTDNPAEIGATVPGVAKTEIIFLPRYRSYLNCLRGLFSSQPLQVHYYQSPALRRRLQKFLQQENYDLIFVHLLRMAEYAAAITTLPKILDLTDALSLNYARSLAFEKERRLSLFSLAQKIERRRIRQYEAESLPRFDRNLLISPIDRDFLGQFAAVQNVEIIGPGVDLDYFAHHRGPYNNRQIIFLGKMSTFPNKDAALYFYETVFPLVLERVPDMNFVIAGIEPPPEILALARHPQVKILGHVPDVRPYLNSSLLSVCPMRTGAGAKNKVLESLAAGVPVVATSLGLEGLQLEPGAEALLADTPEEFAAHILRLVDDQNLRQRLSQQGRRCMEKNYGWETVLAKLVQLIDACVSEKKKTRPSLEHVTYA